MYEPFEDRNRLKRMPLLIVYIVWRTVVQLILSFDRNVVQLWYRDQFIGGFPVCALVYHF